MKDSILERPKTASPILQVFVEWDQPEGCWDSPENSGPENAI